MLWILEDNAGSTPTKHERSKLWSQCAETETAFCLSRAGVSNFTTIENVE